MANDANENMPIGLIVSRWPEAAEIMMRHGLHCIGCGGASMETLEQGARVHGMGRKETEKMLAEINKAIRKRAKGAK